MISRNFWRCGSIALGTIIFCRRCAAMDMPGMYGPYSMTREASGTSWQPDSSTPLGLHGMNDSWMYMLHGFANVGYTNQDGRGRDQAFTTNMLMFMAQRLYEGGSFGFRSMATLEPLMGKRGYPLLFQTGETADGQTPLISRQHPHDLFMELSVTANHEVTENSSVFAYAGLPGEPALGPPAFMHRLSADDNPEAPIGHHWMDSTHVTYGVLTTGLVAGDFKLESSVFRGREPDQSHWNIENPKLDSVSERLSYNPASDWSMQVSYGRLKSPEQLFPTNNSDRGTASVEYNRAWRGGWSNTTLAGGRNWQHGIDTLDALLLESTLHLEKVHTIFTRLEYVEKDDLLPAVSLATLGPGFSRVEDRHPFLPGGGSGPLVLNIFGVTKGTLGYIYDFAPGRFATWGLGMSGSIYLLPGALAVFYGHSPWSYLLFARVKLGGIAHLEPFPVRPSSLPRL